MRAAASRVFLAMMLFFPALVLAQAKDSAAPKPPIAPPSAPTATEGMIYNTTATEIGALLDNPATKAVLDKHLPGFTSDSQISLARSMTLASIQQYIPDTMTDAVLAAIDADLAKLSGK